MTQTHDTPVMFNSVLSFKPLLQSWRKVIEDGNSGAAEVYQHVLSRLNSCPELLEEEISMEVVEKNNSFVEQIMTTIFPLFYEDKSELFAAVVPFTYNVIYSSRLFRERLLQDSSNFIKVPGKETADRLADHNRTAAYQLLLKKVYGVELPGKIKSVHPYTSTRGIEQFIEVEFDNRFIEVKPKGELPELPEDFRENALRISDLQDNEGLMDWFPLENVVFEGFSIVEITDVTEREVVNEIKNQLLQLESFNDTDTWTKLQDQVGKLLGVAGLHIGITPFFYVNDSPIISQIHSSGSIFLKNLEYEEDKLKLSGVIKQMFEYSDQSLLVPEITEESLLRVSFLQHIQKQGWHGIIICPLYNYSRLAGTLEIVTEEAGKLNKRILVKLEPVIPLFELALKKSAEILEAGINRIIKEQFTAVQSSVEWRFTQAALKYLVNVQHDDNTKIEPIVFDNVYPLYGAIDVRNSSIERNTAIQKDMLAQLEMVGSIINKAESKTDLPLLKEIGFRIKKYLHSVSNIVLSDEEISINYFLKREVVDLFKHLQITIPEVKDDISEYFAKVSSVVDMIYHHRKNFDESITLLNHTLARFIDMQQMQAQNIYPHYFERFVTDGVDYNIYIGQSISPGLPFNEFYLKNIKIWQLATLAKAARIASELEDRLAVPLKTTQLILAHNKPISISFRSAERKFDVDGAYNIRYEIIKKRIDKVRVRDTEERLTKPGHIAIVYTEPKEAEEYTGYIEYLHHEGLLEGEPEWFELEELQGVAGLKAIRVKISTAKNRNSKQLAEDVKASLQDS